MRFFLKLQHIQITKCKKDAPCYVSVPGGYSTYLTQADICSKHIYFMIKAKLHKSDNKRDLFSKQFCQFEQCLTNTLVIGGR